MRLLKDAWHWLRDRRTKFLPETKPETDLRAIFVENFPDALSLGTIYIAGENGRYWAAAMCCPCRCGAAVHLSLVKEDAPSWYLTFDRKGRPTLSPSIWRTSGCRSHFFVRHGMIIWCESDFAPVRSNEPRCQGY
jgi:hypothetical protein